MIASGLVLVRTARERRRPRQPQTYIVHYSLGAAWLEPGFLVRGDQRRLTIAAANRSACRQIGFYDAD
jgi:predicted alpha/beta-fold hydrolase